MSVNSQLASLINNIDLNMEDGDEIPCENQTGRNHEQKHVPVNE